MASLRGKDVVHRKDLMSLGTCDNCNKSLSMRKTAKEYTIVEFNYTQIFHPGKCYEAGTDRMIKLCFKELEKKAPENSDADYQWLSDSLDSN